MTGKNSFLGCNGTKEEFVKRSTGRSLKAEFSRNQGAGRKKLKRRKEAFGEKQNLEEVMKERRNAKVEEGERR